MALTALVRTGIGVGKKLLGRKKKTKWQAEGEDPAAFTKKGTRRKPKWRAESGTEHAAPKPRKATKRKKKKKVNRQILQLGLRQKLQEQGELDVGEQQQQELVQRQV